MRNIVYVLRIVVIESDRTHTAIDTQREREREREILTSVTYGIFTFKVRCLVFMVSWARFRFSAVFNRNQEPGRPNFTS